MSVIFNAPQEIIGFLDILSELNSVPKTQNDPNFEFRISTIENIIDCADELLELTFGIDINTKCSGHIGNKSMGAVGISSFSESYEEMLEKFNHPILIENSDIGFNSLDVLPNIIKFSITTSYYIFSV